MAEATHRAVDVGGDVAPFVAVRSRVVTAPEGQPAHRPVTGIIGLVAAVGFVAVNIDLDALGMPSALPLATLTWLVIVAAWSIPAWQCTDMRTIRSRLDGTVAWWLALFALAASSVVWSVHPMRSLVAAAVAAMVFLGAAAVTQALGWAATCRLLSGSLLFVTAAGLFRDVVSGRLISAVPSVLAGEQRFSGLSFSPTDLGRIAAFAVVVSTLAAVDSNGRGRMLHGMAVVVALLALLSSGTRLVVLVLLVVGAVAAMRRRTLASVVVAAVAAGALITVVAFPSSFAESVARPGEPTSHVLEFAGRTPVWSAALDVVADRPLFGYGWVSNEVVFREAFIADIIDFDAFTGHNLVVGVLVDLGVVGATLVLLGLIALWRANRSTGPRLLLLLVVLTGTIEATLSRPSLTIAVLGMVAAAGNAEFRRSRDHA
jgi:O-antigen ligase